MPENLNSEGEAYYAELKNGYTIGGDFTYYFNESSGIGFHVDTYRSKASARVIMEEELPDGTTSIRVGGIKDDVKLLYIGGFYSMRFFNWNYNNFGWMRFGLGYHGYRNDFQLIDQIAMPFTITGGTVGVSVEVGYDIGVSEKIAFGSGLGIVGGVLSKMTYDYPDGSSETIELDSDEYEGLGRLNLTVGIRFL